MQHDFLFLPSGMSSPLNDELRHIQSMLLMTTRQADYTDNETYVLNPQIAYPVLEVFNDSEVILEPRNSSYDPQVQSSLCCSLYYFCSIFFSYCCSYLE
jgi:hypothetical protein